jgi:serine phosphatase RsbU (regulator of sigma subunit)
MFVFRRTDKAPLYFALFCLCVSYNSVGALLAAFSPIVSSGSSFYYLIVKMTPLINYLGLWALLSHYAILFPETLPVKFVKTLKIGLVSLFAIFMFMPAKWIVGLVFVIPYSFTLPAVSLYILIRIARSLNIKNENAPITYVSFFPFVIAMFFTSADMILLLAGGNGIPYYVVPALTYTYIVFQSILLSRRTSNALSKVEEMSRDLEKLVGIRTTELEIERNRRKNQTAVMQDELNLARRIQMKFIPAEAPENIAFHYKPMYQIGGDYFDFIRHPDGRIGIFISDVSGHGVPAAFVTSMIKSFSLENTEALKTPSDYLMQLNDFLLPMTAGNFITAFYAIYDPFKKVLEYSNAGHNPPMLLSGGAISSIFVRNGFPLAVMSGAEMKKMRKNYVDNRLNLKYGDKAFFYTDGLTEAVSVFHSETAAVADFEAIGLLPTLNEAKDDDAETLIRKVMERLAQFRGSDEFDDDVCIICLEAADGEDAHEV